MGDFKPPSLKELTAKAAATGGPVTHLLAPRKTVRSRAHILVRGINLHALKDRTFRLGSALLLKTGEYRPCSRMEENLGPGGYNAVRGHGGITARIITAGQVHLGDPLDAVINLDLP